MCSSTRGPARAPSLVTWPTMTVASPRVLESATRLSAHARTWVTEPGAGLDVGVVDGLDRVDDEQVGRHLVDRRQDARPATSRRRPSTPAGQRAQAGRPPLDLLGRLLGAHHQAPQAAARPSRSAPAAAASTCRCPARRRPGSPNRAPAPRRGPGRARRRPVGRGAAGAHRRRRPAVPAAGRWSGPQTGRGDSTSSAMVFHSSHVEHLPVHRGVVAPQAEQRKTVRGRLTTVSLETGSDGSATPPGGGERPGAAGEPAPRR